MSEPSSTAGIEATCHGAAQSFRRGEEAAGSAHLAALVEVLGRLAAQGDARLVPLGEALQEIVAAQGRGDFLRIADVLEFVVGPALRD